MAIEFGTPSVFFSGQMRYASVVVLDSSHFAVAYNDDGVGDQARCIVGTYSGTTITGWGTIATITTNDVTRLAICRIDDTHFAVSFRDNTSSGDGKMVVCSVSGTTVTVGTESTYTTTTSNQETIIALDTSRVVVGYDNGGSYGALRVASISGTTISGWGTELNLGSSISYVAVDLMDTDKLIVATSSYNDATAVAKALVVTASGTTLTANTPVNLFGGNNAYATTIRKLDTDKFLFIGFDTDDSDGVVVCGTISGTTVDSVGTPVVYNSGSPQGNGLAILDSSTAITTSDSAPNSTDISISGTTITLGDAVAYNSGTTATSDTSNISYELSGTTFVNVFEDVSNSQYGTAIIGSFEPSATDNSLFFGTNF